MEHTDLLLRHDARYLSKGKCLQRYWKLKGPVMESLTGLSSALVHEHVALLNDPEFMAKVPLLTDIQ